MKLCTDTITIFNARFDAATDRDAYVPTVVSGVSWYDEIVSNVDSTGLKAADKYTIRIPVDADFHGKSYVDPIAYQSSNVLTSFTLKSGDIVVKGDASAVVNPCPSNLQKAYYEMAMILSVTDNRRAIHAKHWTVIGK